MYRFSAPFSVFSLFFMAVSTGVAQETDSQKTLSQIVSGSSCARNAWSQGEGKAPLAFTKGVALVFARSLCNMEKPEVKAAAAAVDETPYSVDGLARYASRYRELGMDNSVAGATTLRHLYTLLLGLGMQESTGRYCLGRYMVDPFNTADSAEAGPFQTSWGAHVHHPSLAPLFERYRLDASGCLLDVFSKEVSCKPREAKSWGDGDGADWQKLTKSCPAFATEYAAVVVRAHGAGKTPKGRWTGEFGPLRQGKVELRRDCDEMLSEVQAYVAKNPDSCKGI